MRLHELNLAIGKKVSLKVVGLDYKNHSFQAQLLGYQKGESVLLTLLSKPGQVLLHKGLKATVEGAVNDGYFSFEAEIDEVSESPFLHLHLEYPVAVQFTQVRQHVRVPVDTPVQVCAHTGLGMTTSAINGYMLDVSYGGARLVLEKELTGMVTKISVGVMLSSQQVERDFTVMAEVRNRSKAVDDYPKCQFAYGVEFVEISEADDLFLRCVCLQEQILGHIVALEK